MSDWAGIKYALNSTLGTEEFLPLDQLMSVRVMEVYEALRTPYVEYESAGTFEYTVPDGIHKLYIAACAGGAGGTGASGDRYTDLPKTPGAGGGGGEAVINYEMRVTPGEIVNITVGAGGGGGVTSDNPTAGTNGGNTVVGSLTLTGGKAGTITDVGAAYQFTGGNAGGPGGGRGGNTYQVGTDGILGKGGEPYVDSVAGGGGGSIGNGGFVDGYKSYSYTFTSATRGGGGSGGMNPGSTGNVQNGRRGAPGYVMISVIKITDDMINGTAASANAATYSEAELMAAYREGVESVG